MRGSAIPGGEGGVGPEQVPLGAGPDAVEQLEPEALLVEVAVSVAGEVACAVRDGERSGDTFARVLGRADVGLVIAEALVLGPELRAGFDRPPGGAGKLDRARVETLG